MANIPNGLFANAETPPDIYEGQSLATKFTDCFDLFCRKAAVVTTLTVRLAALVSHVPIVIGWCPNKEMGRITASWIVTAVAYIHSFWDWAMCQFPGETVGADRLGLGTIKYPITPDHRSRSPRPARIRATRLIYLSPETNRRIGFVPRIMAGAITKWRTFFMVAPRPGNGGKIGLLAATTATISISKRPIITHKSLPRVISRHSVSYLATTVKSGDAP